VLKFAPDLNRNGKRNVFIANPLKTPTMQFNYLSTLTAGMFAAVIFAGCDRREESLSEDAATAESLTEVTDRAIEEVAEAAMPLPGGGGGPCAGTSAPFGTCATLTDSGEGVYPRTVVVDFGSGCTGPNGVTRSGIISLVITGDILATEGATWTATFEDFAVGNRVVNGTKTRTFTGANAEGQPTYSFTTDLSIVRNGASFAREASGTAVWLAGYDTEECFDNVVQRDGHCDRAARGDADAHLHRGGPRPTLRLPGLRHGAHRTARSRRAFGLRRRHMRQPCNGRTRRQRVCAQPGYARTDAAVSGAVPSRACSARCTAF